MELPGQPRIRLDERGADELGCRPVSVTGNQILKEDRTVQGVCDPRGVADECSHALATDDQAPCSECVECASDRRFANTKLVGQVFLRGETRPGREVASATS